MKGFDMGKIKDSLNDIQKKLLKIVLILVGMEVVVTLLIGLPLSAAMFHTERLKDGITARDFFVFSDLLNFRTWVFSFVILLVAPLLYYAVTPQNRRMKGVLKGSAKGVDSPLAPNFSLPQTLSAAHETNEQHSSRNT